MSVWTRILLRGHRRATQKKERKTAASRVHLVLLAVQVPLQERPRCYRLGECERVFET